MLRDIEHIIIICGLAYCIAALSVPSTEAYEPTLGDESSKEVNLGTEQMRGSQEDNLTSKEELQLLPVGGTILILDIQNHLFTDIK